MYEYLNGIPLVWGKVISVLGFAAMTVWTWFHPREYIFKDAPDRKWWRDLRIWATVLLVLQIIIYVSF